MFRRWLFLLLIGVWLAGLGVTAAAAEPEEIQKLKQERLKVAREGYELCLKGYVQGQGTEEQVAAWSRRLLDAERALSERKQDQVAALEAYLMRAKDLEQAADQRFKAGVAKAPEVLAARFHRLEAELWLAEGKGK